MKNRIDFCSNKLFRIKFIILIILVKCLLISGFSNDYFELNIKQYNKTNLNTKTCSIFKKSKKPIELLLIPNKQPDLLPILCPLVSIIKDYGKQPVLLPISLKPTMEETNLLEQIKSKQDTAFLSIQKKICR